jgi:hypothetical protein
LQLIKFVRVALSLNILPSGADTLKNASGHLNYIKFLRVQQANKEMNQYWSLNNQTTCLKTVAPSRRRYGGLVNHIHLQIVKILYQHLQKAIVSYDLILILNKLSLTSLNSAKCSNKASFLEATRA